MATFTVKLNTQPIADITILVSSNDTEEGTVSPDNLTFTPENWNARQTVMVTGVDDDLKDDYQDYQIILSPITGSGTGYDKLDPDDVSVTNVDNDTPGFEFGVLVSLLYLINLILRKRRKNK